MPKDSFQWTPERNQLLYNLNQSAGRFNDDFKTNVSQSALFSDGTGDFDTSVRARLKFIAKKMKENSDKPTRDRAKKGRVFWTEEDFCVGNVLGKKGRKGGEGGVAGSMGAEVSVIEANAAWR